MDTHVVDDGLSSLGPWVPLSRSKPLDCTGRPVTHPESPTSSKLAAARVDGLASNSVVFPHASEFPHEATRWKLEQFRQRARYPIPLEALLTKSSGYHPYLNYIPLCSAIYDAARSAAPESRLLLRKTWVNATLNTPVDAFE